MLFMTAYRLNKALLLGWTVHIAAFKFRVCQFGG